MNNIEAYPVWTAPVAAGHQIANVSEYRDGQMLRYSMIVEKHGFGSTDWDRFLING